MRIRIVIFALVFCALPPAQAGGPYIMTESGNPSRWDNSSEIEYHIEDGSCAANTNAQMVTLFDAALSSWYELAEVDLTLSADTSTLNVDVDGDNYGTYTVGVTGAVDDDAAVNDGINPVIFDDDGEIVAAIAGDSNKYSILGLANPSGFEDSSLAVIIDGQAVINCLCLEDNPNGPCSSSGTTIEFSADELIFTIVHEMGHFLNLDHTQVNIDVVTDTALDEEDLPTMFPVAYFAAEQIVPHQDDIVALAYLYPASDYNASTCLVTGDLLDRDGNALRCADVWAVNEDISLTVAQVSGALAEAVDNNDDLDTVDNGECSDNCGHFQFRLVTEQDYTITVMPIEDTFINGSGMGPCYKSQLTGIEEEEIATVTAAQCSAGSTIALGSITTTSTGGVDTDTGTSGGSGGSDAEAIESPIGWWGCGLGSRSWMVGGEWLGGASVLITVLFCYLGFRTPYVRN